jgi:GNAT superfamily N-acetyltransferase
MEIQPFRTEHLSDAAALFTAAYRRLRLAVPALPDHMESAGAVQEKLAEWLSFGSGLAAIEGGRLEGYLIWALVDGFRETDRKGAYCPEFGHSALESRQAGVYQALYRAASQQWAEAGCQVHAITLLANEAGVEKFWYWSGFGLAVVDAIRPMQPLGLPPVVGFTLRQATAEDAGLIYRLDEEHWRHYSQAPVFMTPRRGMTVEQNLEFLARPNNSLWLAFDGETPAGFIRFDGHDYDGVFIPGSEDTIGIGGAYVRPEYRGRGLAAGLLDAALCDYAGRGFTRMAVNFESFNPEAASFWPRYFQPVCLSLMRTPEYLPR